MQRITEKKREPSKAVELESVNENLDREINKIKMRIDSANAEISNHNRMVGNLQAEKSELTAQVWRSLLDNEIKDDLTAFNNKKAEIKKAIDSLEKQIKNEIANEQNQAEKIRNLEKDATSIQPTIDDINGFLTVFGFQGFSLRNLNTTFSRLSVPTFRRQSNAQRRGEELCCFSVLLPFAQRQHIRKRHYIRSCGRFR